MNAGVCMYAHTCACIVPVLHSGNIIVDLTNMSSISGSVTRISDIFMDNSGSCCTFCLFLLPIIFMVIVHDYKVMTLIKIAFSWYQQTVCDGGHTVCDWLA